MLSPNMGPMFLIMPPNQVACKIVHVSSGGDVVNHVDTLSKHFHTVGSPVMIGMACTGRRDPPWTVKGVCNQQKHDCSMPLSLSDPPFFVGGSVNVTLSPGTSYIDI